MQLKKKLMILFRDFIRVSLSFVNMWLLNSNIR